MSIIFIFELILTLLNSSIVGVKFLNGKIIPIRIFIFLIVFIFPAYILINKNLYFVLSIIATFVFPLFIIKNIRFSSILYTIALYQAIILAVTSSLTLIINSFCNFEIIKFVIDFSINVISTMFLILIKSDKATFLFNNFYISTGKGIKALILFTLYVCGVLAIILTYIPGNNTFNIWYRVLSFLFIAIIIASSLIYPICISNIITKNYYKKINKIANQQLDNQIEYYNNLNESTKSLREFKHNYKNMLIALSVYLNNNDVESAKDFIKKSNLTITENQKYNTGNYVLDALLYYKSKIAEKYNTKIVFNGIINENEIDNIDLCIIFGNAIDNAIEACQHFNSDIGREININIKHLNKFMIIHITNPVISPMQIENNHIFSTKKDAVNHGFGIKSISKIASKYSGELEISIDNDIFILKIYLSIT
jgi:hypothetical protein